MMMALMLAAGMMCGLANWGSPLRASCATHHHGRQSTRPSGLYRLQATAELKQRLPKAPMMVALFDAVEGGIKIIYVALILNG